MAREPHTNQRVAEDNGTDPGYTGPNVDTDNIPVPAPVVPNVNTDNNQQQDNKQVTNTE